MQILYITLVYICCLYRYYSDRRILGIYQDLRESFASQYSGFQICVCVCDSTLLSNTLYVCTCQVVV